VYYEKRTMLRTSCSNSLFYFISRIQLFEGKEGLVLCTVKEAPVKNLFDNIRLSFFIMCRIELFESRGGLASGYHKNLLYLESFPLTLILSVPFAGSSCLMVREAWHCVRSSGWRKMVPASVQRRSLCASRHQFATGRL
jgi:hypothetical protein